MSQFNEAMFKTRIDNIFVKLHIGIMKHDLTSILHYIGSDLEKEIQDKINNLKLQNKRQIYDEINVKDTKILNRYIENDKEIVEVELVSRYIDYIIDMKSGNILSGQDNYRIEKRNILKFEKKINSQKQGLVRKCPGCGASIDVNMSGKCNYCDAIYNLEDYDYILVSMLTI